MSEEKNSKFEKVVEKAKNKKISLFTVIVAIVAIALLSFFAYTQLAKKPGKQETVTVSTLEKVVKTSTLSTYETVYNGVSVVMNEQNPDKVDYYVAYESTVKAGLDFNKIEITKNEEEKEIVIKLPQIALQEPNVRIENQDIIVVNKRLSQDALSAKAFQKSIDDVKEEARNQKAIYEFAKQNAEKLLNGLITPFVDQMDDEYNIVFKWEAD